MPGDKADKEGAVSKFNPTNQAARQPDPTDQTEVKINTTYKATVTASNYKNAEQRLIANIHSAGFYVESVRLLSVEPKSFVMGGDGCAYEHEFEFSAAVAVEIPGRRTDG